MINHLRGSNFAQVWDGLLNNLMVHGSQSSPRGHKTREILNVTIEIDHGLNNILVNPIRGVNYRFMVAEWLWILAGMNDVHILARYNAAMRKFSDDGQILSGAYGPRLMPQIPYIVHSLFKEDSRQAVATIWTPSPSNSLDIPCTISLQWMIRDKKLHCTVNMRSSDVWLGLPYDFYTFSQITNYVAMLMQVPVGSVTMNLASSHIYEPNFNSAMDIIGAKAEPVESTYLTSPQIPQSTIPDARDLESILRHESTFLMSPFWRNYGNALRTTSQAALEVLSGLESISQA